MAKRLPLNPNLEHLKKQAKQLVRDHQTGQVQAFARIQASFPRLADASVGQIIEATFTLCNAQLVVAREYGFSTWKDLAEAVELGGRFRAEVGFGGDPGLERLGPLLTKMAATDLPLFLQGESGTGKGQALAAVHHLSPRCQYPLVRLAVAAVPEALIDSELFGHEEGAFTGAVQGRLGKVETAQGGTLFLDGVDKLPLGTQERLVRLVEAGEFERVGGEEVLEADIRLVVAAEVGLAQGVERGTFSGELAFLLTKLKVELPSLRQRPEDIVPLAEGFVAEMAVQLDQQMPAFNAEAKRSMLGYDWPGNRRELEHRVQRAVILSQGAEIGPEDLDLV
jgi:DNA-binding NtrC family response regulator